MQTVAHGRRPEQCLMYRAAALSHCGRTFLFQSLSLVTQGAPCINVNQRLPEPRTFRTPRNCTTQAQPVPCLHYNKGHVVSKDALRSLGASVEPL
jgi:hypothetical protein